MSKKKWNKNYKKSWINYTYAIDKFLIEIDSKIEKLNNKKYGYRN